jgi:hypothetical protein
VLGQEPFATNLKASEDDEIQTWLPESINVVVVGGETGGTYKMITGGVRDSIVSIDEWR